jgi:hypothetical protein
MQHNCKFSTYVSVNCCIPTSEIADVNRLPPDVLVALPITVALLTAVALPLLTVHANRV